MITEKDIKLYQEIFNKLEDLAEEILSWTISNYPKLVNFGGYSTFENFIIESDSLSINYYDYGYDLYDSGVLEIPLKEIYNNSWKEYLLRKEEERLKNIAEQLKRKEINKKEQELKLLKELKEEYD